MGVGVVWQCGGMVVVVAVVVVMMQWWFVNRVNSYGALVN